MFKKANIKLWKKFPGFLESIFKDLECYLENVVFTSLQKISR